MLKVGQRVRFKTGGKCARLEGMSGRIVTGTVESIDIAREVVVVNADYRFKEGARFYGMSTIVGIDKVIR